MHSGSFHGVDAVGDAVSDEYVEHMVESRSVTLAGFSLATSQVGAIFIQ